jgi:hypothetical protein
MNSTQIKKSIANLLIATSISTSTLLTPAAYAQSEASVAVSMLPIASVVVAGAGVSMAAGAIVSIPIALAVSGSYLIVKTVESTARGTIYVLERASDGATAAIEMSGYAAHGASLVVGSAVTVSAIGAGVILISAGAAIAFIPNEIGRALLRNERITF